MKEDYQRKILQLKNELKKLNVKNEMKSKKKEKKLWFSNEASAKRR